MHEDLSGCLRCPRLAEFLGASRQEYPHYYGRPVPSFGDQRARLLVVGLAPGLHGANASGRPFTGDHAGLLLYQTLYDAGFASHPQSLNAHDGLRLNDCRITNAVRCVPPANKPLPVEIQQCNAYLVDELTQVPPQVVLALGLIAHQAVLRALRLPVTRTAFRHGAEHELDHLVLLDSYHCSRYNTQTRRLTPEMFTAVFRRCRELLDAV